ncbi:hypothetical protein COLO4_08597 [Corchorus olitorius]|uniref:TIR domain-containing protein n=1 Tax=Corchorus olitorius TaxID=93759 RepID=A0A1R3KF66_9ROSI|nr:hypothetical protein COLO4_08597 [Corchorus olitorius]
MASSFSSSPQPRYQVFLSFRGEDTRANFTGHLRNALRSRGIKVFFDEDSLQRGSEISPVLLGTIKESMISVIVFSKNYADSSWCLEEVSHIMECWHSRQQLVVPIFYHVDPSLVRNQTGSFKEDFAQHERKGIGSDKIQRWRDALKKAGNLSGFHLTEGKPDPEPKVIEEIVVDIIKKLNRVSQSDCNVGLVGMGPKLEQIKSLLCTGDEDVRMIGIWGMGGIGKTTLAQAIYNQVRHEFESCYFLANVREELEKHGADTLRTKILSTLLNEVNFPSTSIDLKVTNDRLLLKRVLLVLDDVSDFEQFEKLAISHDHFGSANRIIVTSRDKQVLENGSVDGIYEVKGLNHPDSLQLFSLYAFKQNQLLHDFRDLSAKVLEYAKGLPIALKVLGSALYKKEREYWISELSKLKEHPPRKIFYLLKISFDGLDDVEKNIFLDIACFRSDDYELKICYGGMAHSALSNLEDKCLLTRGYYKHEMHDLLREMGQTIVCQVSENPGERSRLWKPEDVGRVLKNNLFKWA